MCFSLLWFFQLLVTLIIVAGVVAILMVVLPWLLSWLGVAGGMVLQVLKIIAAVIILVALVWLCYDLIICASAFGPLRTR